MENAQDLWYANGLGERNGIEGKRERGRLGKETDRQTDRPTGLRDRGKEVAARTARRKVKKGGEEGKKGKERSCSGAFRKGRGRQQVGTYCHK